MIVANKKTQGFGIIEVLIASTIIVMVISSLTFVARGAMTSTSHSQDRTQAANLAAEGIEIVRQIRDTSWVDQVPQTSWGKWAGTTLTGSVTAGSTYKVGYYSNHFYLSLMPIGTAPEKISLNGSDFTRVIQIDNVGGLIPGLTTSDPAKTDQAFKVTATVTTPSGGEVKVSEVLTNWRPNF